MATSRPLNTSEIEQILNGFEGIYRDRNRSLFMLGLTTGFRISELLSLTIGDLIDESGAVVKSLSVNRKRMKGKKQGREVVLWDGVRDMIANWCMVLRRYGFRMGNEYAFCMLNGEPISYKSFWTILKTAAKKGGITPLRGIGTHSMRKTFALNVWQHAKTRERQGENVDAWKVVQEALGHSDIKSTMHYMSFIDREDINPSIIAAQEAVLCRNGSDTGQ